MAGEGDEGRDGPRPDEGRGCEPYDEEWIQSRPEPLRSRLLNLPGLKREQDYLRLCPVLLVAVKEPAFRRKILRNTYEHPYPFAERAIHAG